MSLPHVWVEPFPPERLLDQDTARAIAKDKAKNENYPYVIWWVMNRGYVALPQGTRPSWLFASEEELVHPPPMVP